MTLRLQQEGGRVSGTLMFRDPDGETGTGPVEGTVSGRSVSLSVTAEGETSTFSGALSEDCRSLRLTMTMFGETITIPLTRR